MGRLVRITSIVAAACLCADMMTLASGHIKAPETGERGRLEGKHSSGKIETIKLGTSGLSFQLTGIIEVPLDAEIPIDRISLGVNRVIWENQNINSGNAGWKRFLEIVDRPQRSDIGGSLQGARIGPDSNDIFFRRPFQDTYTSPRIWEHLLLSPDERNRLHQEEFRRYLQSIAESLVGNPLRARGVWKQGAGDIADGTAESGIMPVSGKEGWHQRPILHLLRPETVTFAMASTRAEREQAYRLLHDEFVRMGYLQPHPAGIHFHELMAKPDTATFVALIKGKVVGTITDYLDGPWGMPVDSVLKQEIDALRRQGMKLFEIGSLAHDHSDAYKGMDLILTGC